MEAKFVAEKIKRVAITLRATALRVDQVEATDRIRACVNELAAIIESIEEEEET